MTYSEVKWVEDRWKKLDELKSKILSRSHDPFPWTKYLDGECTVTYCNTLPLNLELSGTSADGLYDSHIDLQNLVRLIKTLIRYIRQWQEQTKKMIYNPKLIIEHLPHEKMIVSIEWYHERLPYLTLHSLGPVPPVVLQELDI